MSLWRLAKRKATRAQANTSPVLSSVVTLVIVLYAMAATH